MSHEIGPNYNQIHLFPPTLEDLVPQDHPARFIRAFVETLDFDKVGMKRRRTAVGRPNYSPSMLLSLFLYGWMHKLQSYRDLEWGCYNNIGMLWLAGMNYPDHNSFWRFYNDNIEIIKNLFKEVVQLAISANLVGLVLNAVDGTKIMANASKDKLLTKDYIKKVLEQLDEITDEISSSVQNDSEESEEEYTLPQDLSDKKALYTFLVQTKRSLKKGETRAIGSEHKEILQSTLTEMEHEGKRFESVTDPEAPMMKCGSEKRPSYNAQAVVDAQSGIIVAADVVLDANDREQLVRMIAQGEENVGQAADITLADGDYYKGKQLSDAAEKGYGVLVSENKVGEEYSIKNFTYKKQDDCFICPRGHTLIFECTKKYEDGVPWSVYRCKEKGCPQEEREKCTRDPKGRSVKRSPYADAQDEHHKKMEQEENKELCKRRKGIAENVFGNIKQNIGYRQWKLRGLRKVTSQWHLLCLVHNLGKIIRLWQRSQFEFLPNVTTDVK